MCILALVVQDRGRICQRSLEFTVAYTESVRVPRLQRHLLKMRTDALAHFSRLYSRLQDQHKPFRRHISQSLSA